MVDAHQVNGGGGGAIVANVAPGVGPRAPNAVNALYQQQAAVLEMMPIEQITDAELRVDQKTNDVELHVSGDKGTD